MRAKPGSRSAPTVFKTQALRMPCVHFASVIHCYVAYIRIISGHRHRRHLSTIRSVTMQSKHTCERVTRIPNKIVHT